MSEQDNTIRALQLQCQANAKKLDQLRSANKKLRKELSVAKEGLDHARRYAERMCAEGETLERVVEMFAKAMARGKV